MASRRRTLSLNMRATLAPPLYSTMPQWLITIISSSKASHRFGPGFVWLVKHPLRKKYSILTTYLAGSPYPGAHYRRQEVDMNTEDKSISAAVRRTLRNEPVNTVGAHGSHSAKKLPPGGIELNPVLCINTWEHVYLPDYGVGAFGSGGKRAFAERWWHRIDWAVVATFADAGGIGKFQT
jgi:Fe-Mn family superoxide dismutase